MKKWLKIGLWAIGSFVFLLVAIWGILQVPSVQAWCIQKAVKWAENKMNTEISIRKIDAHLLNELHLHDVLVKDQSKDSLLFVGELSLRLSDVLLFSSSATVNSLELKKVYAHIHPDKKNPVNYNFQFILDAFGGSSNSNNKNPAIQIKSIQLQDIRFFFDDLKGANYIGSLQQGSFKFKKTDFNSQAITIEALHLLGLNFNANLAAKQSQAEKETEKITAPTQPWVIELNNFLLEKSAVDICQKGDTSDQSAIYVWKDIQVGIPHLYWNGDSLAAKMQHIQGENGKGFQLRELSAELQFNNQLLQCEHLTALTTNSLINSNANIQFPDSLHSFSWQANLNDSKIALAELKSFSNALNELPNVELAIGGQFSGNKNTFKGKKIHLSTTNLAFDGDLRLKNFDDINNMLINFNAENCIGTGAGIAAFVPQEENKKLIKRIGQFTANGQFNGFLQDFVANGNVHSDIGNIIADLNVTINPSTGPHYDGKLEASELQLGTLLDNKEELGKLTCNVSLIADGWLSKNPKAKIEGDIIEVEAHHYAYHNINLDGTLQQKRFEGKVIANDPHAKFNFEGKLNFADSIPTYDFQANVQQVDLLALKITSEELSINQGYIQLNARGKTVDDFEGTLDLTRFNLTKGDENTSIQHLTLSSTEFKNSKRIELKSDFINGSLNGSFNYAHIGDAMASVMHNYFPSYVDLPKSTSSNNQSFTFDLRVSENPSLLQLFLPKLNSVKSLKINGEFNGRDKHFDVNANVPGITYDQVHYYGMNVSFQATPNFLYAIAKMDSLSTKDSSWVENAAVQFMAQRDSLVFNINAKSSRTNSSINLNGLANTHQQIIDASLKESELILEGKTWRINPNNQIKYDKKNWTITGLDLQEENQVISINTYQSEHSQDNIRVVFSNVNLHQLSQWAYAKNEVSPIGGLLNGNIQVEHFTGKPALYVDAQMSKLAVADDSLGILRAQISTSDSLQKVLTDIVWNEAGKTHYVKGYYDLIDKTSPLHFNAKLDRLDLLHIEPLIQDILSHKAGLIVGDLEITGTPEKPIINGEGNLYRAEMTVNYIGTHYRMEPAHYSVKNSVIKLDEFKFRDSLRRTGTASGSIDLRNLNAVALDLKFDLNKMLVMKTSYEQNELFYGTAIASGIITLKGPVSSLVIGADAKTERGTAVFIPISDSRDAEQHSFVQFVSSRKNSTATSTKKYEEDLEGVTIDFNIQATPDAEITLVMDVQAGDYLKAKGTGNIKVNYSTISTFNMFGDYTIKQGDYHFTFLNAVNKDFSIRQGKIVWNGSPYDASIDLNAGYYTRASFYDLISDMITSNEEITAAKKPVPVGVEMKLNGSLTSPEITFDIIPVNTNNTSQLNFLALQQLQKVRDDPNELSNQIFGLIVLNKFLPMSTSAASAAGVGGQFSGVYKNTLTEFASAQVSQRLNDAYYRLTKDDKTQINLNYRLYDPTADLRNFNEWNVNLSRRFLNDRLTFDGGLVYDYGKTETSNSTNFAGDFLLQYNLTPDGRVKLKGFKKTEYDILSERNRNRTGLGLSYRREFNAFSDLWLALRRKR